ncbi:MAG TPA: hypothetical protein VMU14_03125 [Acidimicrobiales bacterium]|nr:hypothetical protein [Acidimicrobiales bacterium]
MEVWIVEDARHDRLVVVNPADDGFQELTVERSLKLSSVLFWA